MKPIFLNTELINTIIERQLDKWDEARENFFRLRHAERRSLALGALQGAIQYNPARIRSTGASIDSKSIAARPCFLCRSNRPEAQDSFEWMEGWEFLVNPFPILPVHFTIVSKNHVPQDHIPAEMASMAEYAPDLVFFFNGARAGASAPDHLHVQAVLKSELPLIQLAETHHSSGHAGFMSSEQFGVELPFHFISAVITPDYAGMRILSRITGAFGIDDTTGKADRGLINAFFWIDRYGLLRCVTVPRRRHRPACFSTEGDYNFMISPGAIDMAGIVIVPRRNDFDRITPEKINGIYSETAFAGQLPRQIREYFGL